MKNKNDQNIINCHTHIFTIDHVPNEFSKSLLPWPFYKIFTIGLIKWYYKNFTIRGSVRYRSFIHRRDNLFYKIRDILKVTLVLWWAYLLVSLIAKWLFRILINFLKLDVLFSPEIKGLIDRFITLARYSIQYKNQSSIYNFLKKNYPTDTGFVVLSMDMEYMGAGKSRVSYLNQIEELKEIKNRKPEMFPFIFMDPRRIKNTGSLKGKDNYTILMKSLLSRQLFNGIKMYPALGYYPFDKELIPMYEYVQEHEIPIITHCIKGTVFYRGKKEKEWSKHPILKYNIKGSKYEYIPLLQTKNYDFTTNFTHPLNYHCLLDKKLLSEYLGEEKDLSKLKICLAHFGGTDEWMRYKEDAWNNYNNNISPVEKSVYLKRKNTLNHASTRTIWWNGSWLSIIYDLLINYENVYADVSFILFDDKLFPLLKYILQDPKVKYKILFGTDHYLLSQKGVDKELYQNLRSYLGEELFMLIACTNAKKFMKTKF